jgi:thiamine-phosphate pyrophosphorylase
VRPSFQLPRIYPILDAGLLEQSGIPVETLALELLRAGVRFLQYRDKESSDSVVVRRALSLRSIFAASILILNDRVHLLAQTGFDGVHVGQSDLSPLAARELIGPDAILGVSTHNNIQVEMADTMDVDYVAIGPVFSTQSKALPDPVVGLEGVAAARLRTRRPLVAIGGIDHGNAPEVLAAGADSLAVISAILQGPRQDFSENIARLLGKFS